MPKAFPTSVRYPFGIFGDILQSIGTVISPPMLDSPSDSNYIYRLNCYYARQSVMPWPISEIEGERLLTIITEIFPVPLTEFRVTK